MTLTGPQAKQIQDVLLAAFDRAELAQMIQFQLGETLEQIAGGGDLREIVFNLVQWAERSDSVLDLIDGALAANPEKEQLQTLHTAAQHWQLERPGEGESPYKGMDNYDVQDADWFFGRERLTSQLISRLCDQRFMVVIGASGSGKTSLVRAGIIASLQKGKSPVEGQPLPAGSASWPVHIVVPTAQPLETLAAAIVPLKLPEVAPKLVAGMRNSSDALRLYLRQRLAQIDHADHCLLLIDQFEELFTLCDDREDRKHYVDNLLAAGNVGGVATVILTLRADFYALCADYPNLRTALENSQCYIGAMERDELRRAIEDPAHKGGWDFEPELVEAILRDVEDEPGALPLLSHALNETWNRRRDRTMTFVGYREAGGVEGAISKTAEDTFYSLTTEQRAIAKNIFLRLTKPGEGVQDTRCRVPLEDLIPNAAAHQEVREVLRTLYNARLVTAGRRMIPDAEIRLDDAHPVAGQPDDVAGRSESDDPERIYVDVTHEALIREWPTLRRWLNDDREGERTRNRLTDDARRWVELDKNPDALYRGLPFQQAMVWAGDHDADLSRSEREFLQESRAVIDAEERARKAAEQKQIDDALTMERLATERADAAEEAAAAADQASRRSQMAALASLLAVLVLVGFLGYVGWQRYQERGERLLAEAFALQDQIRGSVNVEQRTQFAPSVEGSMSSPLNSQFPLNGLSPLAGVEGSSPDGQLAELAIEARQKLSAAVDADPLLA